MAEVFPLKPQDTTTLDPIKLARGDYNPYPGHPLLVILEVLHYYPNLEEAFKDPGNGNSTVAIGDSRIHGAGSNVYQGLSMLIQYSRGELDLETLHIMANRWWMQCIQGQSPSSLDKVLVPGMELAESLWPMIKNKLEALTSEQ